MRLCSSVIAAVLFLATVACSGGDSNSSEPKVIADTTAPVITVSAESNLTVDYASAYEDAGASAVDNKDGVVPVSVTGSVDTFTPGQYTITYTARDSAGNSATATRVVTVSARKYRVDVSSFGDASFTLADGTTLECNATKDLCGGYFEEGTELTLSATTAPGWNFEYWRGCDSVDQNKCTISVAANQLVYSTASSMDPLTVRAGVVTLSVAQVLAIQRYDATSNILFFAPNTDLSGIEIGNVILADGRGSSGIYFSRRVTNIIFLSGSTTIVETLDVPLEEVIESGTLIIKPADFDASAAANGSARSKSTTSAAGGGTSAERVNIAGLVIYSAGGVQVTATGRVDIDFHPELAFDFGDSTELLRSFRISGEGLIDGSLGLNVSGEIKSLSIDKAVDLNFRIVRAVPTNFGFAVVEIQPFVTLKAALGASVEPRATLRQVMKLGLQWHASSGWTNLSALDFDAGVEFPDTVEASVRFELGAGIKPTILWNGIAGPFMRYSLYGGGSVTVEPTKMCPISRSAFAGARATAGGEMRFLSYRLAIETNPIFIERTLGSSPIACDEDTEAPTSPTDVAAVAIDDKQIAVSWQPSTDNVAVATYSVWRRDTDGGRPHQVAETPATEYQDSGLEPETNYCYYVIATDAAKNQSTIPLEFACASTKEEEDEDAPLAPDFISAVALSTTAVELTYHTPVENGGLHNYLIETSTPEGYMWSNSKQDRGGEDVTLRLEVPKPNTEYCFRLSAYDAAGNQSPFSRTLCATTKPSGESKWTVFLGCQAQPFLLEAKLDLNEDVSSSVEVSGAGQDYDGDNLAYVLRGGYSRSDGSLVGTIVWTFQDYAFQRLDAFSVNLSTGDSGIVPMDQIEVTGCDAQIRILDNTRASAKSAGTTVLQGNRPSSTQFRKIGPS